MLLGLRRSAGLRCLAGIAIYLFEAVLIAGLQAFIFAILDRHLHRRRGPQPLIDKEPESCSTFALIHLLPRSLAAASNVTSAQDAGKAIALGVGAGGGAAGAGAGIGMLFGKVIESVTRQPEMRDEITCIQWLGSR